MYSGCRSIWHAVKLINGGYFYHRLIFIFGPSCQPRYSCLGLLSRGSSVLGALEEVPGQRGRFGMGSPMFTTQIEPQALASGCEGHPVQVRLLGGAGWMCVLGVLALGLRLGTRDEAAPCGSKHKCGLPTPGHTLLSHSYGWPFGKRRIF